MAIQLLHHYSHLGNATVPAVNSSSVTDVSLSDLKTLTSPFCLGVVPRDCKKAPLLLIFRVVDRLLFAVLHSVSAIFLNRPGEVITLYFHSLCILDFSLFFLMTACLVLKCEHLLYFCRCTERRKLKIKIQWKSSFDTRIYVWHLHDVAVRCTVCIYVLSNM